MAITNSQRKEIQKIIAEICETTPPRRKRQLAQSFLELVDRDNWPEYYEVTP